jgi:hypothetical protein
MATPIWQPGTIYSPGSLVQPASTPPSQPDQVTNGGFESGNTGWTLAAGFSIGQFGNGTHFQGTWSLQWDLTGEARAVNNNATEVVAGQVINANCQVQQGSSSSGDAGARVEVLWYDASDEFISASPGNLIDSGSNQTWKQSSVAATAPAGAAFARFSVSAFRTTGGAELWIDNCSWDAQINGAPDGLVFRAVQAVAGYSGATEPTWPLTVGLQVVDNEVTWEAVIASRVVWEASPILVSGEYEPEFPEAPDATVADGTILWTAMNWRVQDEKCPHSAIVAIAASKIFAADEDIIAFSATVNPLDWSTAEDAGYIPFGLNTFGATPVTAMGLYRSNLVAFNAEGYQMWQVDEDPANMAILDASPVACLFPKSVQPVSNDLVMCTPEGARNIGIAGASTNLQAGYFGAQIDPLVLAHIRAGDVPFALFWPAMGQYWLIFDDGTAGSEAFVLTMNGGAKDQSWSRYIFPERLTDWAILNGDLYLRAGDLVWLVDPEVLVDDYQSSPETGGTVTLTAAGLATVGDGPTGAFTYSIPAGLSGGQTPLTAGGVLTGTLAGYDTVGVLSIDNTGGEFNIGLRVPTSELRASPQTAYWEEVTLTGTFGSGPGTIGPIVAADVGFVQDDVGGFTYLQWLGGLGTNLIAGNEYVAAFTPDAGGETGEPFEGYIAWPYLDFGLLGIDKMLEGFDAVVDGTFRVSFGYSQRDTSLATPEYALEGDTLPGSMVPMPLTGPSFQIRFTFDAEQAWEWFATNLYCNNMGTG